MAPSSARRNPETRKPARALPLPGARVALVLPAMSIVFDCIISDGGLGKGGRGRANPGTDGAGGGLSKFVEGLPKTGGSGSCRLCIQQVAHGTRRASFGVQVRIKRIVSFGELPPVCAICLPPLRASSPRQRGFFCSLVDWCSHHMMGIYARY